MSDTVYEKLARHLAALGMGYPPKAELIDILKESFSPEEAEVALAIPTRTIPFQPVPASQIAAGLAAPKGEVEKVLEGLADRGLLFSRRTASGEMGYACSSSGTAFPRPISGEARKGLPQRGWRSLSQVQQEGPVAGGLRRDADEGPSLRPCHGLLYARGARGLPLRDDGRAHK